MSYEQAMNLSKVLIQFGIYMFSLGVFAHVLSSFLIRTICSLIEDIKNKRREKVKNEIR